MTFPAVDNGRILRSTRAVIFILVISLASTTAASSSGLSQQTRRAERAGDVLEFLMPALAASYSVARRDGRGVGQFAIAFAANMAVTQGLKISIDKERPNGVGKAMPSGHTASSFGAAAYLQRRYGFQLGVPMYLLAGFVGWSRVASRNHDAADVVAGASIAVASTFLFVRPQRLQLQVAPTFGPNMAGISLQWKWKR